MTYTTAEKNLAAKLLCSHFPNLHFGVARAWAGIEAGANNNVFGVTVSGVLQRYPTIVAGVNAAAARIKSLLVYRSLAAAFSSPHTKPSGCPGFGAHALSQATAICRSPWNTGVAGLKAQGGYSHYYARVFRDLGYRITTPEPN